MSLRVPREQDDWTQGNSKEWALQSLPAASRCCRATLSIFRPVPLPLRHLQDTHFWALQFLANMCWSGCCSAGEVRARDTQGQECLVAQNRQARHGFSLVKAVPVPRSVGSQKRSSSEPLLEWALVRSCAEAIFCPGMISIGLYWLKSWLPCLEFLTYCPRQKASGHGVWWSRLHPPPIRRLWHLSRCSTHTIFSSCKLVSLHSLGIASRTLQTWEDPGMLKSLTENGEAFVQNLHTFSHMLSIVSGV